MGDLMFFSRVVLIPKNMWMLSAPGLLKPQKY